MEDDRRLQINSRNILYEDLPVYVEAKYSPLNICRLT